VSPLPPPPPGWPVVPLLPAAPATPFEPVFAPDMKTIFDTQQVTPAGTFSSRSDPLPLNVTIEFVEVRTVLGPGLNVLLRAIVVGPLKFRIVVPPPAT
jgi:hypothetical protein